MSKIDVLDKGSVELIHILGDDFMAVRAARTSHLSIGKTEGDDIKLLKYLYSHGHSSVFEFNQLIWHIKAPLFVITHFLRHRAFSFSQQSGRYTQYTDDYYIPDVWRLQDKKNKQGSSGVLPYGEFLSDDLANYAEKGLGMYNAALELGVAKEMARYFLPSGIFYHHIWIRTDLRNLLHFFDLRTKPDAQWETRQYAAAMLEITEEKLPKTIQIWREYV